MAAFLPVAAKHCRQAEDSLQQAAGFFNAYIKTIGTRCPAGNPLDFDNNPQ
jgi:hypothetical protein